MLNKTFVCFRIRAHNNTSILVMVCDVRNRLSKRAKTCIFLYTSLVCSHPSEKYLLRDTGTRYLQNLTPCVCASISRGALTKQRPC